MSTESTDFQKYLWQDVRLCEGKVEANLLLYTLKMICLGTFAHMNTLFYTVGIPTQIREQPNDLYDLDTE
jgi:hypothetical protein